MLKKTDNIQWQSLFDCLIKGVLLRKILVNKKTINQIKMNVLYQTFLLTKLIKMILLS